MNIQRYAVILTMINLVLLIFLLAEGGPALAQGAPSVVRARALEIIDGRGRVRASITVEAPTRVDGRNYPETVLLRMSDPGGRPVVKLDASMEGSGLGLWGESERTLVAASAKASGAFVKRYE